MVKKITTTEEIAPESVLRVYKKHFGYAKVQAICSNPYFFAVLCENEMYATFSSGDSVEMYLWVEDDASYEFELTVAGKLDNGSKIVFFNNTENISWNNGRRCLEAVVDIPLSFFTFPGKTEKIISSEKIVPHDGRIILLGDREAVIRTSVELEEGLFLKGNFSVGDTPIEMLGKIEVLNPEKNIYNIIFAGMDRETDKILEYVFKTYRED